LIEPLRTSAFQVFRKQFFGGLQELITSVLPEIVIRFFQVFSGFFGLLRSDLFGGVRHRTTPVEDGAEAQRRRG